MGRKPKAVTNGKGQRRGCNCKRSGCLKNYCECYESKTPCTKNCKCQGCRNTEDRKDDIINIFDQRAQTKTAVNNQNYTSNNARGRSIAVSSKQVDSRNFKPVEKVEYPDTVPITVPDFSTPPAAAFIDSDVTAYAVTCMLQTAVQCEVLGLSQEKTEFMIIRQLGLTLTEFMKHVDKQKYDEYMLYDKAHNV